MKIVQSRRTRQGRKKTIDKGDKIQKCKNT